MYLSKLRVKLSKGARSYNKFFDIDIVDPDTFLLE